MSRARFAVSCLALIPLLSIAQEQEIPDVSREPLRMMQQLSMLAGDWTMTMYSTDDEGETWNTDSVGPVSLQFVHKGFALEEIPGDLETPGFHMRTMIAYDQYRKVYRKTALDDIWGMMDLYEGNIVDGKLVLDNLKARTFFPVGDGKMARVQADNRSATGIRESCWSNKPTMRARPGSRWPRSNTSRIDWLSGWQ